jgi:transposase-like protein
MHRIVFSITSVAQHVDAVGKTPDLYRPQTCPHCGVAGLWRHGCYFRKADRELKGNASRNPVAILRYCCAACWRTCSRLPLCIAPRRWYDWALQQAVLLLLLSGHSLRHCSRSLQLDRHTVRRWRDWLHCRTDTFAFFLRSRFPELGRSGEGRAFWRTVLDSLSLANAMAWLDRELIVP